VTDENSYEGIAGTGFHATFGTLNDTLYYNPVANTLQQVGSVPVNPGAADLGFADNRPGNLTGHVNVSLTLGSISFDSTLTGNGGGGVEYFGIFLQIPVTGSYTFTTGGLEYTGPVNYTLNMPVVTEISSVTLTSLTFSQMQFESGEIGPYVASVTASNGFGISLYAGADDGTYDVSWATGPIVIEVPEPGGSSLLVLGATGLVFLLMRRQGQRMRNVRWIQSILCAYSFAHWQ
jgi:hypothetical protein